MLFILPIIFLANNINYLYNKIMSEMQSYYKQKLIDQHNAMRERQKEYLRNNDEK